MATDSPEVLSRLESTLDVVDRIAWSLKRQMGIHAVIEELVSHGREALLVAARNFDPDKGVSFRKWASFKVRGAMIESMRSKGPLPKRVYRKLRAIQCADQVLEVAAEEDAAAPALTPDEADARLTATLTSAAHAKALGFLYMRSAETLLRPLEDHDGDTPEDQTARAEMARIVRQAIEDLPDNERRLIVRHYFDDVTCEEAGRELGLSKSWASRLHSRAIEALVKSLKKRGASAP